MEPKKKTALDTRPLAMALDQVAVGITIIDLAGRILYFNEYCARFVDRKAEYIGRDIRDCHKKAESVARIDAMLETLHSGRESEIHYETKRGDTHLAVTVVPFETDGELAGFIQSFVVK